MAFSRVGWDAAAFRLKTSWASFALSRALARPRPSSKAVLAALKFRADRRSRAANWVLARLRAASTPALLALAICSGVRYMSSLQDGSVRFGFMTLGAVYCSATIAILQIKQPKSSNICASQYIDKGSDDSH